MLLVVALAYAASLPPKALDGLENFKVELKDLLACYPIEVDVYDLTIVAGRVFLEEATVYGLVKAVLLW